MKTGELTFGYEGTHFFSLFQKEGMVAETDSSVPHICLYM
jgi:hypothetical protein